MWGLGLKGCVCVGLRAFMFGSGPNPTRMEAPEGAPPFISLFAISKYLEPVLFHAFEFLGILRNVFVEVD